MLYPPGHARRDQLPADMYELPRHKRWFFVAEQLETALFEGLPARLRLARAQSLVPAQRPRRLEKILVGALLTPAVGLLLMRGRGALTAVTKDFDTDTAEMMMLVPITLMIVGTGPLLWFLGRQLKRRAPSRRKARVVGGRSAADTPDVRSPGPGF